MQLESNLKKLELGCGERPTPGYIHNDINSFPGVDLVGNPWEIEFEDNELEEVLALGVVEHLTYSQVDLTFKKINSWLSDSGRFVFDVPDIPVWCQYVCDYFAGLDIPFEINHVFATLYGWQRWPGDEHKSGWYKELLIQQLKNAGFTKWEFGVDKLTTLGHTRNRMTRPHDAHLYVVAYK